MSKKLIYFTISFNEDYINLLNLCIKSIYYNNYDGDFLFITDLKDKILDKIKFKKTPYFLELGSLDLFKSSANKFDIFQFEKIKEFEKIIFCDSDILFLKNPNILFDKIKNDSVYLTKENDTMNHELWGSKLLNDEEKGEIDEFKIPGMNAGIFGFKSKMVNIFKEIKEYMSLNMDKSNSCLEQPFLNVYLYRNKLYNTDFSDEVTVKGYHLNEYAGTAIHFTTDSGNYYKKYEKITDFIKRNPMQKKIKTRNDLLDILPKNMIVAEIGVFKGDFSEIILQKIDPIQLHLIDIFEGKMCSGNKDGDNIIWTELSEDYEFLKTKYENNKKVTLHKGYSHDILNTFNDNTFDMIYVDGDHSYNGVKRDLEIAFLKVKKGGYICGHDYSNAMFPSVVNAVNEFCEKNNLVIKYITEDGCPSYCIIKT